MKKVTTLLLAAVLLAGMLPRRAAAVDLNLNAKSALLMDVATGTVLYEKECHERLAPASVTKVMTMLLIMEALDDGRIHLDDQVTASETAAAKGGITAAGGLNGHAVVESDVGVAGGVTA